jgi:hypothetical protein
MVHGGSWQVVVPVSIPSAGCGLLCGPGSGRVAGGRDPWRANPPPWMGSESVISAQAGSGVTIYRADRIRRHTAATQESRS